jgi:hypothetical protein
MAIGSQPPEKKCPFLSLGEVQNPVGADSPSIYNTDQSVLISFFVIRDIIRGKAE